MPSMLKDDPLSKPYVPIDTDIVDDIEHYASDQIHVQIEYRDRDGLIKTMRGMIADVYTTKDSEEYLKMMDGRTLRLDQLVTVQTKENEGKEKARAKDVALDLEARLDIKENKFFPGGLS